MAISVGAITFVPALTVWHWPTLDQYGWLGCIGLLASAGQYATAQSLRASDAVVVMPVDFLRLIWATVVGLMLFSELPDAFTYAGAGLIIASNLYNMVSQQRSNQSLLRRELASTEKR